jgi:hypothetical protein
MPDVKFRVGRPGADRIHYVTAEDVRVVLSRLPTHLWSRLRAVHFNDRSRGARTLGYVNRGRREIAVCALPPRIGLTRALRGAQTATEFGAAAGRPWPALAVRRFLLYDVFLHELGHLQLVQPDRRSPRLRFAREKLAERFAVNWYHRLWAERFDHPDPVHNAPAPGELAALTAALPALNPMTFATLD